MHSSHHQQGYRGCGTLYPKSTTPSYSVHDLARRAAATTIFVNVALHCDSNESHDNKKLQEFQCHKFPQMPFTKVKYIPEITHKNNEP